MNYLKKERNIAPWKMAIQKLNQILGYLKTYSASSTPLASKPTSSPPPPVVPPIYKRFLAWTSSLVEPYFTSTGFEMPKNATEEEMKVHSLLLNFACQNLRHAGCTEFAQQQLFSWLDSSSGEIPIHPRIRLPLLETAIITLQNRTEEVRKFILAQSEAANKTENSNQHLMDMFDKLKKVLKRNTLINMSVTVKSGEDAEMKSDAFTLQSLKDILSQQEPEPEEIFGKLEMAVTKLEGKYKGFALAHLSRNLEPLVSVSHLERLRVIKTRVEQDSLQGLVERAIIRLLSNHIETVLQSQACVAMLVDRLKPLLTATGF